MRRVFRIARHPGGQVIPGAMNRPTKHDQDGFGNVEWWDDWYVRWVEGAYDGFKHGARFTRWRHTKDYAGRQK